jgi:hypothetical protein
VRLEERRLELRKRHVPHDINRLPVVEPRPLERPIIEPEAEPADQV